MPSVDAVLRDWPEAEKSEADWNERAESVMGRLKRGERGASAAYVSNDDLFADPLGQSPEDGHNGQLPGASVTHPVATPRTREGIKMQTSDRERDRKSLQDLAKMAQGLTPPPSSIAFGQGVPSSRSVTSLPSDKKPLTSQDDSGIVDLAAASAADPHAAARAQSTPLGSSSLFEDHIPGPPPVYSPASVPPVSGPHIPAAYAYQQPAPSVPPPSYSHTPSGPPAPYASVHPIAPISSQLQKKKSGGGGLVLAFGGLIAIAAAAAGGFLYIRQHKPVTAPVAVTQPAATPVIADKVADNAPTPDTKAAPSDGTMDLNALPSVSTPAKSSGGTHTVASRNIHAKSPKGEGEEVAAAAPPAPPGKPSKADKAPAAEAPPPSGPPGSLGEAMAQAVPAKEDAKQPAAATGGSASMGNVPQKPSQGAVTGAIGAVLPAARQCLGPDDPISKASVVFNSDGSVYSVTVSGGAAGKPAEACIKTALKTAKLQPFAESSYTANITIRHQ